MSPKPPASAAAVIAALTEGFEDFPPQLQRAARFVIENQREVGVQSMRALATRAEVHPNTLSRLAQAVGFEGWEAMRERFRDFVVSGDALGGYRDRAGWLKRMAETGGAAAVMGGMAEATSENVAAMWRRQDPAALERASDAMLGAPKVYVLGVGAASSLASQFFYAARMAFGHIVPIPRQGSQPIDELAWAAEGEVLMALTFQPYRAETMAAVRMARKAGLTVIGISDSATSPLTRESDVALIAPTHTPHFFESHAATIALLEGLIAVMAAKAGGDVAERIAAFHERRLEAGLYEEHAALSKLG